MNIYSDEQLLIIEATRRFTESVLAPGAAKREKLGRIEPEVIQGLAEMGLLGMTVSGDYGGAETDYASYALALMEIARGDGAVSTVLSVHNAPYCMILEKFGSDSQKKDFLIPAAHGDYIGAFALTESHTGSDAAAIRCRAVNKGDYYLINGNKQFITSGKLAKFVIVFALTKPELGKKGISAFLMPTDIEGYEVTSVEEKMGQKASDTCSLGFNNIRLPIEYLIGEEGDGYRIALSALEVGRIGIASQSVGMAQAALDFAVAYAQEREAFGKPIIKQQAVAFRLAEARTQLEAARQLTLSAARMKDAGVHCLEQACMAKLCSSETAERVISASLQTLGGYGYVSDFPVERIYRDARVCQIYEGTSDIQKLIISRSMGA